MNKRLSIFYLGFCLVLAISACYPLTTLPEPTPTPDQPAPTQTPDKRPPAATKVPDLDVEVQQLDGLQITFLHPWAGETGRLMDQLVNEFNQTNEWGFHVIVSEPGSMGLVIEELENPDADALAVDLVVAPVSELLSQDQTQREVLDLNAYVYSAKFGFSDDQVKDFTPVFWNENLVEGKLIGIPAQETASVLFYNSSWAAELGFSSVPKTGEAFKLQTCAANASFRKDDGRSNDNLGGWIISQDAGTLFSWLNVNNALDLTQPVEKFASEKTDETFLYLFNLQKNSCAWRSRLPQPYDYFATRQALAYSGTLQDILPQTAAFERSGSQDQWRVIAYPSTGDSGVITEGLSYGIFKSDEDKQLAAWLFIRWLSQPANQARMLQITGSLPLGSSVMAETQVFEANYPQWKAALSLLPQAGSPAVQSNFHVVSMAMEDAGEFLFKPEFTAEMIPELVQELDATIQELTDLQE